MNRAPQSNNFVVWGLSVGFQPDFDFKSVSSIAAKVIIRFCFGFGCSPSTIFVFVGDLDSGDIQHPVNTETVQLLI